ncbi:O-antigen ligase family protein [Lacticigenium naphthae]|uniref:O-antigen ligase family protein n=1 Tax=Lacticigenium naphthae TaxID=515351 RepID=UPI0004060C4B|nr:O-antigen ligase family protein [Lacticigenium naphthae]
MEELALKENQSNHSLKITIMFVGLLLNQSNVLFGLNLSIADIIMVIAFILLLVKNQLFFPSYYLLFFFVFSFLLIVNSVFIIPREYGMPISNVGVIRDYIKICTLFLYFILAFHVVRLNLLEVFLKYFLIFSVFVGSLGIVIMLVYPVPFLSHILLFGETRLTGFMNDPNYFSIIQIAALSIALGIKIPNKFLRYSSVTILIISVLLSGSKTGFITLAGFLVLKLVHKLPRKKMRKNTVLLVLLFCTIISLSTLFITVSLLPFLQTISKEYPTIGRVLLLLTNFEEAVSQDGSGRGLQWEVGLEVMKSTPLNGVGIGDNYLTLAREINRTANLAHNTYIQIAAEWGLLITSVILAYFFVMVSSTNHSNETKQQKIVNEMFFIFLVSSLAISFNYSRLFWMLVGMKTYFFLYERQRQSNQTKDSKIKRNEY